MPDSAPQLCSAPPLSLKLSIKDQPSSSSVRRAALLYFAPSLSLKLLIKDQPSSSSVRRAALLYFAPSLSLKLSINLAPQLLLLFPVSRLNILDFTSVLGDMSIGQPGFTSQEQDSCNPFSFEESSTSPLMEDIDQDGIDVGGTSNDERNNGNDEGNNKNMGNEKNDTQNEDVDPHKHAFQRKPRKKTSTTWNDFEKVVDADGSKKVKCNYFLAKFNMPSTGATTQFHRHLKRCTQCQLASKKQMVLSVETVASDCAGSIANFKYDRAKGEGGQGTTREIGSSSASGGDHDIGKKIVIGSSLILGHVSKIVDTIQPSKSDLDVYLDESAFICAEGSANKFDIMEWWKANTLKFCILSKMARDILSIPITSVASESTFSAGGRVIDPYRASLLPETIQVLLYGADWVLALHGLKKGSEWAKQYTASIGDGKTERNPKMLELVDWLRQHIPLKDSSEATTGLVHGDFRIDNLVFHPIEDRVLGILDRELSTLGNQMCDVAYSCLVAMTHPMTVTNCNIDMESLISDQNRSIATLAITTLLKTGNESSVDRLMNQITNFMSDIADEFKIVVVEAIRSLRLKFPLKYRSL
ncbi:hypothetical protein F0562_025789 [Nyssa sinensis]|uniref:BED-type domain-containing protein n=1 Tax=Nyssa sinensis TaxID=561372 RepID=A0A5J5BBG3_9ASTE|nr:hypothetical protein F0562_025789 [Nyssa sinensis]